MSVTEIIQSYFYLDRYGCTWHKIISNYYRKGKQESKEDFKKYNNRKSWYSLGIQEHRKQPFLNLVISDYGLFFVWLFDLPYNGFISIPFLFALLPSILVFYLWPPECNFLLALSAQNWWRNFFFCCSVLFCFVGTSWPNMCQGTKT